MTKTKIQNNLLSLANFSRFRGFFSVISISFGSSPDGLTSTPIDGGSSDLVATILSLLNGAFGLGILFGFTMLVIAAFTLYTAGGNREQIEKGRETLKSALVGIVIMLAVSATLRFVSQQFIAPAV